MFSDNTNIDNETFNNKEPLLTPEEEVPVMNIDPVKMAYFMDRLSGKGPSGIPNAGIGYQMYALEDPEDSIGKTEINTLSRAYANFTENIRIPGFSQIDIVFPGYSDSELSKMWTKLEEYGKNCVKYPEKTWIFFINFLDSSSVIDDDYVLRACVISPVYWTLTREIPSMLAKTVVIKNDEGEIDLQGGNVIRLLVPDGLLTFQYTESIDTEALKLERMNLDQDNEYLEANSNNS